MVMTYGYDNSPRPMPKANYAVRLILLKEGFFYCGSRFKYARGIDAIFQAFCMARPESDPRNISLLQIRDGGPEICFYSITLVAVVGRAEPALTQDNLPLRTAWCCGLNGLSHIGTKVNNYFAPFGKWEEDPPNGDIPKENTPKGKRIGPIKSKLVAEYHTTKDITDVLTGSAALADNIRNGNIQENQLEKGDWLKPTRSNLGSFGFVLDNFTILTDKGLYIPHGIHQMHQMTYPLGLYTQQIGQEGPD